LAFLPRDTFTFESTLAYDGGDQGTEVLRRVIAQSPRYLRSGGALLLELGGDQARLLDDDFARHQLVVHDHLVDDDGDLRGVVAVRAPSP
jgi:release factor glutamine methyltransferase